MILLGKESHELNGTAAKYLDQNSTAGYFDGLSNPAAQAQQSCSTGSVILRTGSAILQHRP